MLHVRHHRKIYNIFLVLVPPQCKARFARFARFSRLTPHRVNRIGVYQVAKLVLPVARGARPRPAPADHSFSFILFTYLSSAGRSWPRRRASRGTSRPSARAIATSQARPFATLPAPATAPRHPCDPCLVPGARRQRGDGATGATRGAQTTTTIGAIVASSGAVLLVSPRSSSPRFTEGRRASPRAIWPEG